MVVILPDSSIYSGRNQNTTKRFGNNERFGCNQGTDGSEGFGCNKGLYVVDESGNVIRTELYRYRDWYKELSRDYSVLQAKYDSLFSEKQKEIQVPYPVERELSWWQSIKLQVGEIAIGVIIGLIIIIAWLIRRKK